MQTLKVSLDGQVVTLKVKVKVEVERQLVSMQGRFFLEEATHRGHSRAGGWARERTRQSYRQIDLCRSARAGVQMIQSPEASTDQGGQTRLEQASAAP